MSNTKHSGLSPKTRELIEREFGGEYEEAERVARITVARSTRYPGWMSEVLGTGERGWRDPMSWAVRR